MAAAAIGMIWFSHMKTTVEIPDELFARTREIARRDGTTFRMLVEEGLRVALACREQRVAYSWPDLSVGGEGLAPEVAEGDWAAIRDRIYAGQGA